MRPHPVDQLGADADDGVERVHRALGDEGDLGEAIPAHLLLGEIEEIVPSRTMRPPTISPGGLIRRITARAIVDLPEPDSPINPRRSPGCEGQTDAIDRFEGAAGCLELDVEVVDLEDGSHSAPSAVNGIGNRRLPRA